jgi:hypothetical protein
MGPRFRMRTQKSEVRRMSDCDGRVIKVWKRVHRPEEYAADAARWMAGETGAPYFALSLFVPLVRAVLSSWEPAADEFSILSEDGDGALSLRTFFRITNYTDRAVYGMLENVLKKIGVGKSAMRKQPEVDFAWLLLGGVLNEYGAKAGLCEGSICGLLEFRLRNSDYLTATTWYSDRVEIANLKTGRVETLELPPEEIRKVIDWSVDQHEGRGGQGTKRLSAECPEFSEYIELEALYKKITG